MAPDNVIDLLSQRALSILKRGIPLRDNQKKLACRHKAMLRTLANKKVSRQKKRNLLQKGGGGLNDLLLKGLNKFLGV